MSDSQGIPTSEFFCTQGPAARALGRSEQQALSSLLRPKHTHTHTHLDISVTVTACLRTIPMALSLRCMLCEDLTNSSQGQKGRPDLQAS